MTKHSGYMKQFKLIFLVTILVAVLYILPQVLFAEDNSVYVMEAEFVPLVGIPGVTDTQTQATKDGFNIYINALYIFAITVGALLAVLKLVAAGVKYMFSDIVTNKMDAINDIKGAILGLLIVISAFILLNTINPELTNFELNPTSFEGDTTITRYVMVTAEAQFCRAVEAEGRTCEKKQCTGGEEGWWSKYLIDGIQQAFQSCEDWCTRWKKGKYFDPRYGLANAYCRFPSNSIDEGKCIAANGIFIPSTTLALNNAVCLFRSEEAGVTLPENLNLNDEVSKEINHTIDELQKIPGVGIITDEEMLRKIREQKLQDADVRNAPILIAMSTPSKTSEHLRLFSDTFSDTCEKIGGLTAALVGQQSPPEGVPPYIICVKY